MTYHYDLINQGLSDFCRHHPMLESLHFDTAQNNDRYSIGDGNWQLPNLKIVAYHCRALFKGNIYRIHFRSYAKSWYFLFRSCRSPYRRLSQHYSASHWVQVLPVCPIAASDKEHQRLRRNPVSLSKLFDFGWFRFEGRILLVFGETDFIFFIEIIFVKIPFLFK